MSNIKSIRDPEVQAVLAQSSSQQEFHKSPEAWEDQFMYFLLPDRFSDGNEQGYEKPSNNVGGSTPLFSGADVANAIRNDHEREEWLRAGGKFVGGKIKGVTSKLGYLKRMGVTAIWIGPIFKQIADLETYHGYGIQDFLQVDRRFGTREDLKELVRSAHDIGIYVILDVILNHAGDIFAYKNMSKIYTGSTHEVKGFWGGVRDPDHLLPLGRVDERRYPSAYPDGAIWPVELQAASNFICKGEIRNWDADLESVEGDFFGLKTFNLGHPDPDKFAPSLALDTLTKAYQYWLAYADIDGFRIDTVRHMGNGPAKYFAFTIRTFAQSLGKDNFLLVGEISNHLVREIVLATGLDAALGVGDLQKALNLVPRNRASPSEYFDSYSNVPNDPKRWARNQIVNMIDDHDQVWKPIGVPKARFCADREGELLLPAALGLNICTLGIPCLYYGTEQNFNGTSAGIEHSPEHYADQFIREAMFGGSFGAFGSRNRHFFNESSPTYTFVRDIVQLRAKETALRRGHQHLCVVSPASIFSRLNDSSYRRSQSVIAWLRIHAQEVVLCAINTSTEGSAKAWITLDPQRQKMPKKDVMWCLYPVEESHYPKKVAWKRDGSSARVFLSIPPGGFVVYKLFSSEEQGSAYGN